MGVMKRGIGMTGVKERAIVRSAVSMVFLAFALFILAWPCVGVASQESPKGRLYLVSSGNGDPDNITLRALNTIKVGHYFLHGWDTKGRPRSFQGQGGPRYGSSCPQDLHDEAK